MNKLHTLFLAGMLGSAAVFTSTAAFTQETLTTPATAVAGAESQTELQRYAAERLVQHVNYARVALGLKKPELAKEHLQEAISLNNLLQNSAETYRIKKQVRSGQFTYDYTTERKEHYFPIEGDLMEWKELDQGPFWSNSQGLAVTDANLVYISIAVDTETVAPMLDQAQQQLAKNDTTNAHKTLVSVIDAVVTVEKTVSLPLAQARDNIALARYFLLSENYDAARFALGHAEDGLEQAKDDARYRDRNAAIVNLSGEISKLNIALSQADPTVLEKAEETLKGWWTQLKTWTDSAAS